MRNANAIRLLSWNLLHQSGAEVDDVARLVDIYDPDLVLMQEAGSRLDALPARLGGHYERRQMGHRKHGPAVWSPHAFDDVATIALPRATKVDLPFPVFRSIAERVALVVSVNNLSVANVHLDPRSDRKPAPTPTSGGGAGRDRCGRRRLQRVRKHAPGRVRGCRTATADALRQRPRPGADRPLPGTQYGGDPGGGAGAGKVGPPADPARPRKGGGAGQLEPAENRVRGCEAWDGGLAVISTASAASNGRRMEGQEVRLPGTWPSA